MLRHTPGIIRRRDSRNKRRQKLLKTMLTDSDRRASNTSATPDPQSWTLGVHGGLNGNSQWTRCGTDRTTKSARATDQTITSSQSQQPACHVSFMCKPDYHIVRGYSPECSANICCYKYQLDSGLSLRLCPNTHAGLR